MSSEINKIPQPKRRRKRRSRVALLAARTITDIKAKERTFLRDISAILTDALGFPVRVSHVKVKYATTPDMRRAARMTKTQARRQMADAMNSPIVPGQRLFDDDIGF